MDETDDPSADTAMFRAFVEHGDAATTGAATSRAPWFAAAGLVALVLVVIVALAVL